MPMMPKRVKFRKSQRGKMKGNATRGNYVAFGEYGLQSLEAAWITGPTDRSRPRGRRTHFLRREGRLLHPRSSRTSRSPPSRSKPAWVRARASRNSGCAVVKPGTVLFEITGVDEPTAKKCPGPRRPQDAGPVPVRQPASTRWPERADDSEC